MIKDLIPILFCLLVLNLARGRAQEKNDSIDSGTLRCKVADLRTAPLPLNTQWAFYWDTLLTPSDLNRPQAPEPAYVDFPGLWTGIKLDNKQLSAMGYATYRLNIHLDTVPPLLALSIPDFYSAYQLWVNGDSVASNGKVGVSPATTTPYWLPMTIPMDVDTNRIEIVLQIANFHHRLGGPNEPILLGVGEELQKLREADLNFSFALFGCFIICGLFFFGFSSFGQGDWAALFFSLGCLSISYRMVGVENYPLHHLLPGLPWKVAVRLEYLSMYLATIAFWEYAHRVLVGFSKIRVVRGIQLATAFLVLSLLAPVHIFTWGVFLIFFLLFVTAITGLQMLVKALISNWREYFFISAGFVILLFIVIYTIGDNQGWWLARNGLVLLGYVSFLLLQSMHLSKRFAQSFRRAVDRADAANKAKSDFLAAMSHEIRTPMNGVIGMTHLLDQTELKAKQREYLQIIKVSGENLMAIINDILDFSKIEAQKMDLNNQDFDLSLLIREISALVRPKADRKSLELSYQLDQDIPGALMGDPMRLRQVLINLLDNAVKFTESGQIFLKVSLNARNLKIAWIRFRIQDSGIGISQEQLEKLFQPFSQAKSSISHQYGGTGLGLAISQKLVGLMGGQISVKSQPCEGSTFSFTIPMEITGNKDQKPFRIQEKISLAPSGPLASEYPLNILVVEDHKINQQLITTLLKNQGYRSDLAADGRQALDAVHQRHYDIVFMDIQMPVMDGLDATRRIISSTPEIERPVIIAMTADAMLGDREKCLAAGMDDYLAKPIHPRQLEEMIVKWGRKVQ